MSPTFKNVPAQEIQFPVFEERTPYIFCLYVISVSLKIKWITVFVMFSYDLWVLLPNTSLAACVKGHKCYSSQFNSVS